MFGRSPESYPEPWDGRRIHFPGNLRRVRAPTVVFQSRREPEPAWQHPMQQREASSTRMSMPRSSATLGDVTRV